MAGSNCYTSRRNSEKPVLKTDIYFETEHHMGQWNVWVFKKGELWGYLTTYEELVPLGEGLFSPIKFESRAHCREVVRSYKNRHPLLDVVGGLH